MNIFREIFSKYDTDKVNGSYELAYEDCFAQIRENVELVYEIGVNRGGSVQAWREYFPNAFIVGLEIEKRIYPDWSGIKIEFGDATDYDFLGDVLKKYGKPDIVIDDGSHFGKDIIATHNFLWRHTELCYVIEDLGTQDPDYKNGFYMPGGFSAMTLVDTMIEELMFCKRKCSAIKLYHSICFMFKGIQ